MQYSQGACGDVVTLTRKDLDGKLEKTRSALIRETNGCILTGVRHKPHTVTHHTHLVQTGLSVEENEAIAECKLRI